MRVFLLPNLVFPPINIIIYHGCIMAASPEKAREVANRTVHIRLQNFINSAQLVHKNIYDYKLITLDCYVNQKSKVPIICKNHGVFYQRCSTHLGGKGGCPVCDYEIKKSGIRMRSSLEYFINKSKEVFGDTYDYSKSVYVGANKPIYIKCKEHGEFKVSRAEKHYGATQGCPTCSAKCSIPERFIQNALTKINVPFFREFKFQDCKSPYTNNVLRFDFYIPSKNTIIEFHGDQHFKPNRLMHTGDKFQRFQHHDQIKKQYVLDNGICYISFTTKDLKQLENLVIKMLS